MAMDDLLFQGNCTGIGGMETVGRVGEGRHGGGETRARLLKNVSQEEDNIFVSEFFYFVN